MNAPIDALRTDRAIKRLLEHALEVGREIKARQEEERIKQEANPSSLAAVGSASESESKDEPSGPLYHKTS